MSRVVGSLIISDQEEDENQGRAAIFKIITGKIKALDESHQPSVFDVPYERSARH
jgi:hypothetical protein